MMFVFKQYMDFLRVTDIISWCSGIHKIPKHILERAADRGTRVHVAIEGILNGLEPLPDIEISPYLESFQAFYNSKQWSGSMETEKRLYSEELGVTGCMDLIHVGDSVAHIYDWKTSSTFQHKSAKLQGAAYRYLASVNGYENLSMKFVHLQKDGSPAICYEFETYEQDLDTFFKCLDIYKYFNEMETLNENE